MSINVLLVDDQAMVRAGFRMILEAEPNIEVVGEAEKLKNAPPEELAHAVRVVAAGSPDVRASTVWV